MAGVLLADQGTKAAVIRWLPQGQRVPVLGGWLHWTLVHNPGGAFGLFPGWSGAYLLVAVLALGGAIWYLRQRPARVVQPWLGMIGGGVAGNLLDRLRWGAVVDFIDLGFWPAFNLADVALVCGVMGMVWVTWRTSSAGRGASDG